MSNPVLSVLICTHNPRRDYLARVIEGLRRQTLAREHWELLIIDNASRLPVENDIDLAWHSSARIVVEPRLGIGFARTHGMSEAAGELHLHVDDDNVLKDDYLESVVALAKEWPKLGAFGAGTITPEYERQPGASVEPYLPLLTLWEHERERWSNSTDDDDSVPAGAGMCVRRDVARYYCSQFSRDPLIQCFGRKGKEFAAVAGDIAGEDTLIAWAGRDLGYGWGTFPQLAVTHLIPAARLEQDYMLKLAERYAKGGLMLHYAVSGRLTQSYGSVLSIAKRLYHNVRLLACGRNFDRRIYEARIRGVIAGQKALREVAVPGKRQRAGSGG